MKLHRAFPLLVALGALLAGPRERALAQIVPEWKQVATTGPSARSAASMAYDSLHGKTVLFGGVDSGDAYLSDTWEWNGTTWARVATTGPSARAYAGMAYDSARDRTVLFGGQGSGGVDLSDTWERSASGWTRVATTGPPAGAAPMAYDSARGRTVLHTGSETWEWDGSQWHQAGTAGPVRLGAPLAYDSTRHKTVLQGGWVNPSGTLLGLSTETWEWDGSTWTMVGSGPTGASGAMAYDSARGRTVLHGGMGRRLNPPGFAPVSSTSEWDGTAWKSMASAVPSARSGAAMAYDSLRHTIVLFGGSDGTNVLSDTWQWGLNVLWKKVATTGPSERRTSMAYDSARGKTVLFGGWGGGAPLSDTCEWDGSAWRLAATTGPSGRHDASIAYHSGRGRTLLFGGYDGSSPLSDTWEWDGSAWTQVAETGPPARYLASMAYDSARDRMVLFGGSDASGQSLRELWEWDGTEWTQVPVFGAWPGRRYLASMVYDSARGRTVLFGGMGSAGIWTDTWEWNGSTWTQVATTGPPGRFASSMAYDSARGRSVLFGGQGINSTLLSDTWEWDGSAWRQIATTTKPTARSYPSLAYDSIRGRTVLFGGYSGGVLSDTWEYGTWNATKLAYSVQPAGASPGIAFTTQPVVQALDSGNGLVTTYTGRVSISIKSGTGTSGAVLGGTKAVDFVNGVATFTNLSINLGGAGYVLRASSEFLAPAESAPFSVAGPAVYTLADVQDALRWTAGMAALPSGSLTRFDVAPDSRVDLLDAIRIARKVAGLEANP